MYLVNGNKKFGTLEFFQVMALYFKMIRFDRFYIKLSKIFSEKIFFKNSLTILLILHFKMIQFDKFFYFKLRKILQRNKLLVNYDE